MLPYLRLCMATWSQNLPDWNVVVLDHSNLDSWMDPKTYDQAALRSLPLAVQKDAILVGVLAEHGGLFMDVDTIAVNDLAPFVAHLERAEVVTFSRHLAVVAARPGSPMMATWLVQNQARIGSASVREQHGQEWDFAGNRTLEQTLDVVTDGPLARRLFRVEAVRQSAARSSRLGHIHYVARRARHEALFRTTRRGIHKRLARDAFMPERGFYADSSMNGPEKYVNFWFGTEAELDDVFLDDQMVIGLHNSWTPAPYGELSEAEVLADDRLLSRTLRHIVA